MVTENILIGKKTSESFFTSLGAGFFGNQISDSPGFVYCPSRGGFVLLVVSVFECIYFVGVVALWHCFALSEPLDLLFEILSRVQKLVQGMTA